MSLENLRPFSRVLQNGLGTLALQADVIREGDMLRFSFVLSGPVEKLRIPSFSPQLRRADDLWKTTCFEAFISSPGSKSYWELNFSPSGAWNCYRFGDYRKGMRPESAVRSVEIQSRQDTQSYWLQAEIDLPPLLGEPLEISLTAVIEGDEYSYWALKHAGEKPDFHLRESFIKYLG